MKYYFKKINYEYVRNTIDSNLISKIYENICTYRNSKVR